MLHPSPLLLYDGECGFCARSVQFLLRHERRHQSLRFAPLQGRTAAAALASHPIARGTDSMVWYEAATDGRPERLLLRSEAVREAWRYLGGPWRILAVLSAVVPRRWRDRLYDLVARHRHSLSGGRQCLIPAPAQRERFLDLPPT